MLQVVQYELFLFALDLLISKTKSNTSSLVAKTSVVQNYRNDKHSVKFSTFAVTLRLRTAIHIFQKTYGDIP